jgi:DNA-binding MarR family transcriptional regulator
MIEVSTSFCETDPVTRWLTPDEQRSWRNFLEAHRLVFARLERQLQAEHDLSHWDYEILVRLSEAPERRLRMSDLADATLSSRSRLSHAVGRMERLGWIERTGCPDDRRGTLAGLTDAGLAALEAAAPGHVDEVRRSLVDRMSAQDFATLGSICESLVRQLEASEGASGAGAPAGP